MTNDLLSVSTLCDMFPGIFNPNTLAYWRANGMGPRYARIGRRIFYSRTDIEAWMNSQFVDAGARGAEATR